MSEAILAQRAAAVDKIVKQFEAATSAVVVNYRGLTVDEVTELRKELRESGVKMEVLKNTYLRRAAVISGYEGLDDIFKGPTAIAFSDEAAVAPARVMANYACKFDAL